MSGNVDERQDHASELLSSMADILAADGYELGVRWPQDQNLELVVTAGPEACEECLIPAELFRSLAAGKLGDGGLSLPEDQIRVVYPGS